MKELYLTIGGTIVGKVLANEAETIIYEKQAEIDEKARLRGLPYGELVSTEEITGKNKL